MGDVPTAGHYNSSFPSFTTRDELLRQQLARRNGVGSFDEFDALSARRPLVSDRDRSSDLSAFRAYLDRKERGASTRGSSSFNPERVNVINRKDSRARKVSPRAASRALLSDFDSRIEF